MNKTQVLLDLFTADKKIKRRTKYKCGLVSEQEKAGLGCGDYFFESPDGQNGELYYELQELGYSSGGYNAPYYWKIVKDGWQIAYIEGDIYIKEIIKK